MILGNSTCGKVVVFVTAIFLSVCSGKAIAQNDTTFTGQANAGLEIDGILDSTQAALINTASIYNRWEISSMHSIKLGLQNEISIGAHNEADSYGSGKKIFYYRNKTPFSLRRNQSLSFGIHVGDADRLYCWVETFPSDTEWDISFHYADIENREGKIINGTIKSNELLFFSVSPYSEIEVRIAMSVASSSLQRRFWVSLSPEYINRGNGEITPPSPSIANTR